MLDGQDNDTLKELKTSRGMNVRIDKLDSLSSDLVDKSSYASQFGIKGDVANRTITWETMVQNMKYDIRNDLAYDSDVMTAEEADRYADAILQNFDPANTEISVNFQAAVAVDDKIARTSWTPCSNATFDHLYILKDDKRIGVVWVEDED